MADNRISMPQSGAGLMRFYDVQTSLIQLDPRVVFAVGLAFVVVVELAHLFKVG